MSSTAPAPAPTPTSSTGFDVYLQNGSTNPTTGAVSFPAQFSGAAYPGISSKDLNLVVPGSGSTLDVPFPFAPGEQRRQDIQSGGSEQTLRQLMDILSQQSQANPDAIAQLQDKLILAGYLDPRSRTYTPGGIVQAGDATWTAYRNLLLDATRQKQDYLQLLDSRVQSGAGEKKFNLTTSYQSINVTDPQTARHALTSVMTNELGRRPMNSEIADYVQRLASAERANPNTTTVNHDINAYLNKNNSAGLTDYNNTIGTTSTTTGGVDPSIEAENQIYSQNGTELAQARATDIYSLFLRMLGGEGSLA